jgi:hypothetical protein
MVADNDQLLRCQALQIILIGPYAILGKSSEHTPGNHHQRADGHYLTRSISNGRSFQWLWFPEYEADMDIVNVTYFYS